MNFKLNNIQAAWLGIYLFSGYGVSGFLLNTYQSYLKQYIHIADGYFVYWQKLRTVIGPAVSVKLQYQVTHGLYKSETT